MTRLGGMCPTPRSQQVCIVTLLLGVFGGSVCSQAGSDSVGFNVKVTIVQSTCEVNNSQPINVEFGEMLINAIDGAKYEQTIPYTLQCDGAASNQGLRLSFLGAGAIFNGNLLQTSDSGLGLRFKQNGSDFALNDDVNFTYGSKPTLSVVPVLRSPTDVSSGDFSASATFNVEYQ